MDTWKRPAAVAFNGRMSSRIKDRMERRSDHASDCLRTTLQDFVPAVKNDSRIGAVVDFNSSGGPRFNLGIFGVDDALPLVSELEDVEENQVVYVTLGDDPRDYTKMHLAEVASVGNAADLAEQLFYEMLGDKPVAALGSGVCLIKDGEFNFGVFTP